jgi:hypothetical protein
MKSVLLRIVMVCSVVLALSGLARAQPVTFRDVKATFNKSPTDRQLVQRDVELIFDDQARKMIVKDQEHGLQVSNDDIQKVVFDSSTHMRGGKLGRAFGGFGAIGGVANAVMLLAALPALAQQGTSQLGGKITDAQGGALPGVNFVITNENTGVVREVVSTDDGSYFAAQMAPGRYRIQAKLEGFRLLDRRDVVLMIGQTTTLDLTMEVGTVTETVTVTGEAPLIDVTSAQVGAHISAAEIAELPSAVRNYMSFAGSAPSAQFLPSAGFGNDTVLVNGQPAEASHMTLDGAANIDDRQGSNVGGQARVGNEALQEVQILTHQFDAEFGRASGAIVNAITKSGTNALSGSAFAFFTGKSLTARNFFTRVNNQEEPEVAKDEWGGSLGGPILRNRLFFFVTAERLVYRRPAALTFLARPEFNFSTRTDESSWNTLWRIDYQMNANNTFAYRWLRELSPQFNRTSANSAQGATNDETDLDQTMVGTWTSVVSNTKVNTMRVSATLESFTQAHPGIRAVESEWENCAICPNEMLDAQVNQPPRLVYQEVNINSDTMHFAVDNAYSVENTFSWFIPSKYGRHDTKFGAKYTYIWIDRPNADNMNGTYTFGHNLRFDPSNPRTYPERLSIRVPGIQKLQMISRLYEAYAQDKWQIGSNFTLSLGVRYDLEVTPIDESNNPLFTNSDDYPVDKNNVAPRIGMVWSPSAHRRSVVRGGYGIFYDKTLLTALDEIFVDRKYSDSFEAVFPQDTADPNPGRGLFPAEPVLNTTSIDRLTPQVRAIINSRFPPGSIRRNTGTVVVDDPERRQPYFHQASIGYEREVLSGLSASVDYVHMSGRSQFLNWNLNVANRVNTSRTGPIQRLDPFGVLNASLSPGEEPYVGMVQVRSTRYGYSDYEGLNLSLERRYANNWSARAAYALGYSRGTTDNQADTPDFQVGTDMNLDEWKAPADVDRRHTLTLSGRVTVPRTGGLMISGTLRAYSGRPFTIEDDNIDTDQNGILFDPLPAGVYDPFPEAGDYVMRNVKNKGGRNGARGPGFMQLDMRSGYRRRLGGRRTLDMFAEVFNVTDRANFTNPNGDRRNRGNFLRLANLVAGTGFPRQLQFGLRFGF